MSYVLVLMSTVVWLLFSAQFGSTKEFHVVPSNDDVEKCQAGHDIQERECHTLVFYMNCSCCSDCPSSYFNSNESYIFWNGRHSPLFNNVLAIEKVENITFTVDGEDNKATIDCNGESVGFVFNESSDITLENLVFLSCIRTLSTAESSHHALATLAFHNGANLYLTRVTLNGSVDEALYVHNIQGVIHFKEIMIINSRSNVRRNTNVIYNSECNNESLQIVINNSIFSGNYNKPKNNLSHDTAIGSMESNTLAAGLSITLKCLSVNIQIENVTMKNNHGGNGGNLALVFHNTSSTPDNIVTIRNCTLESGSADTGGGLFVEFVDSSKSEEALCLHSPNKSEHQLLLVIDTTFKSNSAVYAGGAVYLKQKQSKASCSVGRISFINCIFQQNFVITKGFGGTVLHSINYPIATYKHHGVPQFKIIIEHCDFKENFADQKDVIRSGNGVIFSKADSYFKLVNVRIRNNTSSGILAISSNIILSGNISIKDNRASSGGGLLLCQNAIIYFDRNTFVTIANNHVVHTGGGISVETQCLQSRPMCFFQLTENILQHPEFIHSLRVHIYHNSAGFAGHNLFGGSVDHCFMLDGPDHKHYFNQSIEAFRSIFYVHNYTSSITSEPQQVCLCRFMRGSPICNDAKHLMKHEVYPGQPFTMIAVLVGQLYGIVPGTVLAQIEGCSFAILKHEDKVQKLARNSSCGSLTYTVYTNESKVQLQLSAQHSGDVSGYEQLNQFKKLKIDVTMKKCPPGFALFENNGTISCNCVDLLKHHTVVCDIAEKLIIRRNPNWIGYVKSTNTTLFHPHCPFDYCVHWKVNLKATDTLNQDLQCTHHRTGILCGACHGERSAVIGSNRCHVCSNYWLFMLGVIVISGVLLVFLLSTLNITITEGTLGGILFYCNIISSNSTFYFQDGFVFITRLLKIFVSSLSLNMGGSSMCLYNGMDTYAIAWVSFVYPFYIWLIAGVIICSGHKFKCVVRHNSVKVLATLIILSYSTLLASVIEALQATYLHQDHGKGTYRWLKDGNLRYFHGKHIPLVIFASLFGLILLPFTFCLLCMQCLLKVSHYKMFSWVNHLKPFFDAYTGPFTARARFWTGLLLFARIVVYTVSAVNFSGSQTINIGTVSIISFALLFIASVLTGGLYKRRFLGILEHSLLFNLGILSTFNISTNHMQRRMIVTHLCVGVVFFTFIGIILYHVKFFKLIRRPTRRLWLWIASMKKSRQRDYQSDDDQYDTANFPPLAQFDQTREPLLD